MADEADLREHQPEEDGDAQRPPRVPHKDQRPESRDQGGHRDGDLQSVVARATIEETGLSNLLGQRAEVFRRGGLDGGRLHRPASPLWVVEHTSETEQRIQLTRTPPHSYYDPVGKSVQPSSD